MKTGVSHLLSALNHWGIELIFGVNGGAILEITNHLPEYQKNINGLQFFTLSEYAAGFAPIGAYLSSGRIAACTGVTGVASQLIACGLGDAKFLRIPALYVIPLNNSDDEYLSPMQDVGIYGINIVKQIKAQVNADAVYLRKISDLPNCLERICQSLSNSRPTVFLFHPNELIKTISVTKFPHLTPQTGLDEHKCLEFIKFLQKKLQHNKNIYLYICSEAGFNPRSYPVIKQFQQRVNARIFCSVNGSNACVGLPNYYGHIGLGGQPEINHLWGNLNDDDVLICLGIEAGDYHFFEKKNQANETWILTNLVGSYGFINETYQHRFSNFCQILKGDLVSTLTYLTKLIEKNNLPRQNEQPPPNIILSQRQHIKTNLVDLVELYQSLQQYWQYPSLCFDDVCAAYRDRQFIMHYPHPNIRFYSSQDASTMGATFGMLVGAKLANPQMHCFAFSGDGCWRLFAGAMPEACDLGIVLFILNNKSYGIVEEALPKLYPDLTRKHYHTQIANVDYVMAAKACGWDGIRIKADLSNLKHIMYKAYHTKKSLLIEVPCEPYQGLGFNPRIEKLNYK